jgi:hypothetical protein
MSQESALGDHFRVVGGVTQVAQFVGCEMIISYELLQQGGFQTCTNHQTAFADTGV